jgi:uncharacterized lipoprotein NlpE involved in copper resistance
MMNKLIIALLAAMMMIVVGCAATKTIPATTPFTAAEIGDAGALEEVADSEDEAVEDLADMVSAES